MSDNSPTISSMMNTAINPTHVRETLQKVDKCMARLQEIQVTLNGGRKFISGVTLSPRSTNGYIRPNLRCDQEALRMTGAATERSPASKFPEIANVVEWRKMSLPAMLLDQTLTEIVQASKLLPSKLSITTTDTDPRTPDNDFRSRKLESSELRSKCGKEKQHSRRTLRINSASPILRSARSRLNFQTATPLKAREASVNMADARPSVSIHRKPWKKRTVQFPNPMVHPNPPISMHQNSFYKAQSTLIPRPSKSPHKFLIKHQDTSLRSHLKSKKAVPEVTISPLKKKVNASKQRRFSVSPSKFTNKFDSPVKTRLSINKVGGGLMAGVKQRTSSSCAMNLRPARLSMGY